LHIFIYVGLDSRLYFYTKTHATVATIGYSSVFQPGFCGS